MSSTLDFFIIISFFIQSMNTQYFLTNQSYYEYGEPWTNPSTINIIKVAYPLNLCTKTGNHIKDAVALHSVFQCSFAGGVVYGPCSFPEVDKDRCAARNDTCDSGEWRGVDQSTVCPNSDGTTTTNYMEITFYCGFNTDDRTPKTCPFDNATFIERGFAKLATNVCVDQYLGNGEYYMATCTSTDAEIGIYDSDTCTNKVGIHSNYSRSCEMYAEDTDACNYFRRVTSCMVNGNETLEATLEPSSSPTLFPTLIPTDIPSETPTFFPTLYPTDTTPLPTKLPSTSPTQEPTTEPTAIPTTQPTYTPTTDSPSENPTQTTEEDLSPDNPLPAAGALLSGLNNISLMYIVCGVLLMFYIFICFYIWMNERRKRRTLKVKFQKEEDKEQRKEYMRQKNLQRRLELEAMQGYGPGYGAEYGAGYGGFEPGYGDDYQQMEAHVDNNIVQPANAQLLQEGM